MFKNLLTWLWGKDIELKNPVSKTISNIFEPEQAPPSLDELIDNHTYIKWTEEEMAEWVHKLAPEYKNLFVDALVQARNKGLNVHRVACRMRAKVEPLQEAGRLKWYNIIAETTTGWAIGSYISGARRL